ncbi:MAG: YczE/YyaS/YitT family protein [Turicibacter sp.]
MNKLQLKTYAKKIMFFMIGCFIIQIGVSFFIKSNTGVDSNTILLQGIANKLPVTVGQANMFIMGSVFVFMILFARNYINLGTFLALITAGPFLDLINKISVNLSFESIPYVICLIIVALSCVIIAIGFSILKSANLGVSPTDQLPFIICDKTGFQYKWVRITIDVLFVVIGFSLGGVLGLGTIVITFTVGPAIQYLLPIIGPRVEALIDATSTPTDESEAINSVETIIE